MKKNSTMLPLFIKYEIALASFIMICFVTILTFAFLIPNVTKMDAIIRENDALATKIERLKNKERILSPIQPEDYKSRYTRPRSILPGVADYVSILNTLNALERKTGAIVSTTDFKIPADSAGASEISDAIQAASSSGTPIWVMIGLSGSYEQLKGFLSALNKLDGRLFNVYQANYSKNDSGNDELKLVTSTYSYKLNTDLGSVDSSLPPFDKGKKSILSAIDTAPVIDKNDDEVSTMSGKTD